MTQSLQAWDGKKCTQQKQTAENNDDGVNLLSDQKNAVHHHQHQRISQNLHAIAEKNLPECRK